MADMEALVTAIGGYMRGKREAAQERQAESRWQQQMEAQQREIELRSQDIELRRQLGLEEVRLQEERLAQEAAQNAWYRQFQEKDQVIRKEYQDMMLDLEEYGLDIQMYDIDKQAEMLANRLGVEVWQAYTGIQQWEAEQRLADIRQARAEGRADVRTEFEAGVELALARARHLGQVAVAEYNGVMQERAARMEAVFSNIGTVLGEAGQTERALIIQQGNATLQGILMNFEAGNWQQAHNDLNNWLKNLSTYESIRQPVEVLTRTLNLAPGPEGRLEELQTAMAAIEGAPEGFRPQGLLGPRPTIADPYATMRMPTLGQPPGVPVGGVPGVTSPGLNLSYGGIPAPQGGITAGATTEDILSRYKPMSFGEFQEWARTQPGMSRIVSGVKTRARRPTRPTRGG